MRYCPCHVLLGENNSTSWVALFVASLVLLLSSSFFLTPIYIVCHYLARVKCPCHRPSRSLYLSSFTPPLFSSAKQRAPSEELQHATELPLFLPIFIPSNHVCHPGCGGQQSAAFSFSFSSYLSHMLSPPSFIHCDILYHLYLQLLFF
jgi:hypothetical protein